MEAPDVAATLVDPAADVVHLPGGVELGHLASDVVGVELPPALVERRPHRQRRDVAQQLDGLADLGAELGATGGVVAAEQRVPPVAEPHRPPVAGSVVTRWR